MKRHILSSFIDSLSAGFDTVEAYEAAERKLRGELARFLVGETFSYGILGSGNVVAVNTNADTMGPINLRIAFRSGTKNVALHQMLSTDASTRLFNTNSFSHVLLIKAQLAAKKLQEDKALLAVRKQAEAEKAAKEAEAKAQLEAKLEEFKCNDIKAFEEFINREPAIEATEEFYVALGWLFKNMTGLYAIMPDYLGTAFHAAFGEAPAAATTDVSKKLKANTATVPAWSFKILLNKTDAVPEYLTKYVAGSTIIDADLIYYLVKHCGFQFGGKQTKTKIVKLVPVQFKEAFNTGINS